MGPVHQLQKAAAPGKRDRCGSNIEPHTAPGNLGSASGEHDMEGASKRRGPMTAIWMRAMLLCER